MDHNSKNYSQRSLSREEFAEQIGSILRSWVDEDPRRQSHIADSAGISAGTLSGILSGKPSTDGTLTKIAVALGRDYSQLVQEVQVSQSGSRELSRPLAGLSLGAFPDSLLIDYGISQAPVLQLPWPCVRSRDDGFEVLPDYRGFSCPTIVRPWAIDFTQLGSVGADSLASEYLFTFSNYTAAINAAKRGISLLVLDPWRLKFKRCFCIFRRVAEDEEQLPWGTISVLESKLKKTKDTRRALSEICENIGTKTILVERNTDIQDNAEALVDYLRKFIVTAGVEFAPVVTPARATSASAYYLAEGHFGEDLLVAGGAPQLRGAQSDRRVQVLLTDEDLFKCAEEIDGFSSLTEKWTPAENAIVTLSENHLDKKTLEQCARYFDGIFNLINSPRQLDTAATQIFVSYETRHGGAGVALSLEEMRRLLTDDIVIEKNASSNTGPSFTPLLASIDVDEHYPAP